MARSISSTGIVCLLVIVWTAAVQGEGAKMREWTCTHKAYTGPVRYVHLESDKHFPVKYSLVSERADKEQFRIKVFYEESVSNNLALNVQRRLKRVVDRLVLFYNETLSVRPIREQITFDRDCDGGQFFVSPRRCFTTCAATTMCGEAEIPPEHLKACSQCFGNSRTCSTTGNDGPGVVADFVLYVTAVETETCSGNTIAYASHCRQEDTYDRPIAGYANFCPSKISSDDDSDEFVLAVAKHELLHALGFSSALYPFWRDDDGNPRTPRQSNGSPPRDSFGRYVASTNTLRTKTYENWQTRNGPVSHTVTQLVTPRIVAEGRRHFNCPSLDGVEVENQGGSGTAISHWEKRLLENEGMTGIVSSNPVFSKFTFGLLEDSGWYKVDYSKAAQQLVWGTNSGCDLPMGSCGGYINNRRAQGNIFPFCDRLKTSNQIRGCTSDRTAISQCSLGTYQSQLPQEYQYLNSGENFDSTSGIDLSTIGGSQIPDFCPYQEPFSNGNCSDTRQQQTGTNNGYAQTYAVGSRCVEHGEGVQWTAGNLRYNIAGSGCYQYRCGPNGQVTVLVLGMEYVCTAEDAGKTVSVDVTYEGVRHTGSIICPACMEICYDDFTNCPQAAAAYNDFNQGFDDSLGSTNPNSAPSLFIGSIVLVLATLVAVVLL